MSTDEGYYYYIISTDEDPSLKIDSLAIIYLRGVSTKLLILLIIHARFAVFDRNCFNNRATEVMARPKDNFTYNMSLQHCYAGDE